MGQRARAESWGQFLCTLNPHESLNQCPLELLCVFNFETKTGNLDE